MEWSYNGTGLSSYFVSQQALTETRKLNNILFNVSYEKDGTQITSTLTFMITISINNSLLYCQGSKDIQNEVHYLTIVVPSGKYCRISHIDTISQNNLGC